MVSSFIICGSGSLPREEEGDELRHERATQSAGSTPPRPSSSSRCRIHSQHNRKNPYAARGLDKFSALLSEIQEKKQNIYSEINPDEICFVQFDYSKDNDCKPVVIKVKQNKADHQTYEKEQNHLTATNAERDEHDRVARSKMVKSSLLRSLKLHKLRKPGYYLPAVVILILILLALFGRSMAIVFTSIAWYMIPKISNWSPRRKRMMKKKAMVGQQGWADSFMGGNHGNRSSSPCPPARYQKMLKIN